MSFIGLKFFNLTEKHQYTWDNITLCHIYPVETRASKNIHRESENHFANVFFVLLSSFPPSRCPGEKLIFFFLFLAGGAIKLFHKIGIK